MLSARLSLALAVAITAAPLFMAGCATSSPQAATPATAMASPSPTQAPTATPAGHPVGYAPQVVLPFGDFINHLSGLAVDSASNVYVLDFKYGMVWKQAVGSSR